MAQSPLDTTASASVTDAINTRRSVRAFLPTPVDTQQLKDLIESAARAPSGTNIQPWHTHLLTGDSLAAVVKEVQADYDQGVAYDEERQYYPDKFFEPFLGRRRAVGWGLYKLLDIGKTDREKMAAQHRRNYQFFDAPAAFFFTIHRDLNVGSWLDYGMFLQNVMLLAREQGLHTCPQAAWCGYHAAIRRALPLSDDEVVVCGMAIGHADPDAVENTLLTERASLEESFSHHG
ncbi:MAG: nitroreductase [Granulosicoccaceae bacterium]